jgi:ribonuclease P/MRP protein subunit POP5
MVRVKFRYLVVNFLYPEPLAKSKTQLPDLVQIHSPTPDAFHAGILMRMIRDEVAELYGDYGMGMVSAALKGEPNSPIYDQLALTIPLQSTTGPPPPRPP